MGTMTVEHAPPIEFPTPGEFAIMQHNTTTAHAVIAVTATVEGEIMAVCVCSIVGYGADEDAARADLQCSRPCDREFGEHPHDDEACAALLTNMRGYGDDPLIGHYDESAPEAYR